MSKVISSRLFLGLAALLALQACSSTARFESAPAAATLTVRGLKPVPLPHSFTLDSKATGQYEFQLQTAQNQSLYGILPLRVNGGRMALSILFFAPALPLGGFRDAHPNYLFDVERGEIRYLAEGSADWRVHKISGAESARAKAFFDACAASSTPATDCPQAAAQR